MKIAITKYDSISDDDVFTMEHAKVDGIFTLNNLEMPKADFTVIRQLYVDLDRVPQYVENCAEAIEMSPDCEYFVIHDKPNLMGRGYSWAWTTGLAFSGWWQGSVLELKKKFPGVKFGFPRLEIGGSIGNMMCSHHEFLKDARAAVEAADFIGVDISWQCGSDNVVEMYNAIYYLSYIKQTTGLPAMVTYHNSNNNVSKQQKAEQYLMFLKEVADNDLAFFAACHTLSSDLRSDLWNVWRTDRGESIIPQILGARESP